MTSRWQTEKELVVEASQAMARAELVVGSSGNVSMRLSRTEELLAITPSRKKYHLLQPDHIQIINFEGDPIEGDLVPSVETLMHVAAYRARPGIGAVMHTHSTYASVLAVAGLSLPPIVDEMTALVGGEIRVTPYAFPSTEQLAANVGAALVDRNAVLLGNHGVVGIGSDLWEALAVCEMVERAAQVYVMARAIGHVRLLPDEIIKTEEELFKMMHLREAD